MEALVALGEISLAPRDPPHVSEYGRLQLTERAKEHTRTLLGFEMPLRAPGEAESLLRGLTSHDREELEHHLEAVVLRGCSLERFLSAGGHVLAYVECTLGLLGQEGEEDFARHVPLRYRVPFPHCLDLEKLARMNTWGYTV